MRDTWKKMKIADICDKASSNVAQNKIEDIDGDYPIYGASGYIKNVNFYHRDKPYIGIVKDGSGVGRVNIYPAKSSLLGTMQYILPKDGYRLEFISYALKSLNLASFAAGAAIPHIYFRDYGQCEIYVPSLTEQERIVSELDLLTGIIDKQKAQLKELDTLAQSIFYDMFGNPIVNDKGWNIKQISEIGKVITGNTPSTKDGENYSTSDYCFVKPSDIDKEGVSYIDDSEFHISRKAYYNTRQLPKGSVLTTCIGIIGKVGILQIDATCNQQINAIVPSAQVTSTFLAFSILSIRAVLDSMANAPVVPIINKGDFSKVRIPIPPLELQELFAQKIQSIESQKESIKHSIEETQRLFDYTMDKYFG